MTSRMLPLGLSLLLTGGGRTLAADICLNEIMADNQAAVVNGGKYPDWVELYNTSSQIKDLSGMRLTDDLAIPGKFTFPPNTFILPHGHLVVWFDDDFRASGLHTGFALKADGSLLALLSADVVPTLVDSVAFGLQLPDFSVGRVPDGAGPWQLTRPTAWSDNQTQPLGSPGTLKVNEWMAKPVSGSDWFELYNPEALPVALGGLWLSDTTANPANTQIPTLSFIAARGYRVFLADHDALAGADHVAFRLSASGMPIALFNDRFQLINVVSFGSQVLGVSQGRLPDGATTVVSFPATPTPGDSNYLPITAVVINEVLSHTDPPLEDAIELFNPTAAPVDISGWYLSNNRNEFRKYRIPAATVIPAGGYQVFYEYQFNPNTNLPTSFTFNSAHGDWAYLSAADAAGALTGYRTFQKIPTSENGVSWGRFTTSTGVQFVPLSQRTFGADNPTSPTEFRRGSGLPNVAPKVGPIVISEIMYHPPDIAVGTNLLDNTLDEFVELLNVTGNRVFLFDPLHRTNMWRLDKAVSYTFPTSSYLDPYSTLLVVGFDPVTNQVAAQAFYAKYNVPATVQLHGPWAGKLNNSNDAVELFKPDPPQEPPHPDAGYVPYVLADKVSYEDQLPWPAAADGSGASLRRRMATQYANDPANWLADLPTAGRPDGLSTLSAARGAANSVLLRFAGEAGATYTLQYRDSLTAGSWMRLTNFTQVTVSRTLEATDTTTVSSARYYRLVTPLQP